MVSQFPSQDAYPSPSTLNLSLVYQLGVVDTKDSKTSRSDRVFVAFLMSVVSTDSTKCGTVTMDEVVDKSGAQLVSNMPRLPRNYLDWQQWYCSM